MQYKSLIFLDPLSVNPLKDLQFSRDSTNFSSKRSLQEGKKRETQPRGFEGGKIKGEGGTRRRQSSIRYIPLGFEKRAT